MRPLLFVLLSFASLVSCQKVKDLAQKAKETAGVDAPKEGGASDLASPGGDMDKDLEALIDRTPEGVRFRKDLPFPQRLNVVATTTTEFQNVRVASRSAFGSGSAAVSGVTERTLTYDRDGNRIAFRAESSGRMSSPEPGAPAPDPKAPPAAPPSAKPATEAAPVKSVLSAVFQLKGGRWVAGHEEDFLLAAKIRDLQPGFGQKALEDGLLPRELWFGKTRWKEGSKLTLTDKNMAMILSPETTGKLELVFEAVESVGGHPCGRFSMKGECSGKAVSLPDEGQETHLEVSITDGKVWLSLIQPVVMRSEYDMIATASGKQDGISTRAQGHMILKQSLAWKPGT